MLPDTIKNMDYIKEQAKDYSVNLNIAIALFEFLGENEMYDGFIIALQEANENW